MKDEFYGYHPVVNAVYFGLVMGFTMFFMHPLFLSISLVGAFAYGVYLHGTKAVKFSFIYMLPMMVVTAALNPLFNHRGATIVAFLPGGNPITLESIAHGIAAAVMLAAMLGWFACFNHIMTGDKFVYLAGKIFPALSLVLSVALRLVPLFRRQIKVISNAQKGIGRDITSGSILQRVSNGIKIMSIMVTWALENSIEMADSMKYRGYGTNRRSAFSIFTFTKRDFCALGYMLMTSMVVIVGAMRGVYYFRFFPAILWRWNGAVAMAVFACYFALVTMPLAINLTEDIKWKSIQSKI